MMKDKTGNGLSDRAWKVIPGGTNSVHRQAEGLEDLVVVSTSGATFTDVRGRTYTDYHGGFGPPILGHNDPDVTGAVVAALARTDFVGVGVTPTEIEAAERIVELIPSVEKVLLVNSGTEATLHAVRLARAATGRRFLIKFQGCYHGWHDAVAMNVMSKPTMLNEKDPLSAGILPDALDATLIVPFNDLAAVQAAFADHLDDVAAVIVEPIAHNIGAILPNDGFLAGLRTLCDTNGTVLIFDEVITGFRHALGGIQDVFGVRPDLTTLGKAMANGYPVGAVGGRADLMDMFSTLTGGVLFSGGTFNGHPAIAAAVCATIAKLRAEHVHDYLFALGDRARNGLTEVFGSIDVPTVVSGFGSIWASYFLEPPVESYSDLLRNDAALYVGYRRELMSAGIFELPVNLKRNHLSYAHTEADVDRLVYATGKAVTRVLKGRMSA